MRHFEESSADSQLSYRDKYRSPDVFSISRSVIATDRRVKQHKSVRLRRDMTDSSFRQQSLHAGELTMDTQQRSRASNNVDELAVIVAALTREYAATTDPDRRRQLAVEISKLAEALEAAKKPGL